LGIYFLGFGFILAILLLWGHLRCRSWRFYLPLILPVVVIVMSGINFSLSPNWIHSYKGMPSGSYQAETLNGNLLTTDDLFCMGNCLQEKKIVISTQCGELGGVESIYTELTENIGAKVVAKNYPDLLSGVEYAALLKKDLTLCFQLTRRAGFISLISLLETNPKVTEEELYMVRYYYNYLLIPRKYFREMKGLTEADMQGLKEVALK